MESNYFLVKLRNLQGGNIQDYQNTAPIEPISEEKYLWLLIIDLLVFVGLSVYAYISSKRMEEERTNHEDFRYKFVKSLIVANGGKFVLI
jgi:hypothetical protein